MYHIEHNLRARASVPVWAFEGGDGEKKDEEREKEKRKIKLWFNIDKFLPLKYN